MRRRVLLPGVVALALLTACGDDAPTTDGTGMTAAQYRRAADRICEASNQRAQAIAEENGELVTGGVMPSAARLRDLVGQVVDEVDDRFEELRALDGPASLESDVHEVLDDADDLVDRARDQIDEDPVEFLVQGEPFRDVLDQLGDLGLERCGRG